MCFLMRLSSALKKKMKMNGYYLKIKLFFSTAIRPTYSKIILEYIVLLLYLEIFNRY